MRTFFSLGYQLRDLSGFIRKLLDAQIDLVVDVRETPWSHKPGFARVALSTALSAVGIDYVHAAFAGNPKQIRRQATDHQDCLDQFRDYIDEHPEIIGELDALIFGVVASDLRACFICFERHPDDCHRSILLQHWSDYTGEECNLVDLDPHGAPRFLKPGTDRAVASLV